MKFEVGKFYRNKEDKVCIHIVAEVDTTMWDKTLIAETPQEPWGLVPVEPRGEEWEEITENEWLKVVYES